VAPAVTPPFVDDEGGYVGWADVLGDHPLSLQEAEEPTSHDAVADATGARETLPVQMRHELGEPPPEVRGRWPLSLRTTKKLVDRRRVTAAPIHQVERLALLPVSVTDELSLEVRTNVRWLGGSWVDSARFEVSQERASDDAVVLQSELAESAAD
jgi:hypothetical protein